jgi:hypothetical protein
MFALFAAFSKEGDKNSSKKSSVGEPRVVKKQREEKNKKTK